MTPDDPASTSPFLTLTEAARYARCSTRTVQRWLAAGKLSRFGHQRLLLIGKAELATFLALPKRA